MSKKGMRYRTVVNFRPHFIKQNMHWVAKSRIVGPLVKRVPCIGDDLIKLSQLR